jgi:hypothetical protein
MMLQIALILFCLAPSQDAKTKTTPGDDDDVAVPGLPDGEPAPLPERVQWDPARLIVAKTATRERIDLKGFWRFGAVEELAAAVKRGEMGWIELPTAPLSDGSNIFDTRFRPSDGLWRGKPLDKYAVMWAERDIKITNADVLEWLNRRSFLVLSGSWADSEVFASQRIRKKNPDPKDDPAADVHVHAEQATAIDRPGARWYEITEQLIYPGTTHISLRKTRKEGAEDRTPAPADDSVASQVVLERWPTGPNIESIELRRAENSSGIEATFNLTRPRAFLILGKPPVRTLPMTIRVRVEPLATKEPVGEVSEDIGPMPDLKRTVTVMVPWKVAKGEVPGKLRLRAELALTGSTLLDEAFPVAFEAAGLEESAAAVKK